MQKQKSRNPIAWVPSVYFAMGLPFIALNLVSVIMFKDLGVSETKIAFWTSALTLPYTLKFLWSPLLEIYGTKRNFVAITQLISGICFGLVAFALPLPNFFAFAVAIMAVIGISGATHDIATDGIYLEALDKDTQARYIGWQGAFYNLAKVLANGGLVYLAGRLMSDMRQSVGAENAVMYAWMIIMGILAVLLVVLSVYHFSVLPATKNQQTSASLSDSMYELWNVIRAFFAKKHIVIYLFFIVCYRLTEGFAIKMVPLFLKASTAEGGLGLSNETIGLIYGTLGTVAFIIGSILGGYYIAHYGLRRVLFSLICIFNIPFVIYYLFALYQPENIYTIATGLVGEYFCYGFGFVGLTLFMMQQIAPGKHSMAHYAIASAVMNLGVMLPGMICGWVFEDVLKCNYELFFLVALVVSIPSFILTLKVPFTHTDNELKEA